MAPPREATRNALPPIYRPSLNYPNIGAVIPIISKSETCSGSPLKHKMGLFFIRGGIHDPPTSFEPNSIAHLPHPHQDTDSYPEPDYFQG